MDTKENIWASAMRAERQGDTKAYDWLLRDIAQTLRIILRARLARSGFDRVEAEDILQEVLIGLHEKRHTWDETRPIVPWVASIMRYKLIDGSRRMSRERQRYVDIDHAWLEEWLTTSDTAMQEIEIAQQVASLPGHQKDVVTALALEGHDVKTTAANLDRSEASVRVTFQRALRRLIGRSPTK